MKKLVLLVIVALVCALLAACNSGSGSSGSCGAKNVIMGPDTFCTSSISISKGSTLSFVDDANNGATHILVIGTQGQQQSERGAPDFGGSSGKTMNPGDSWTTPPWNTPGTFHVTCTVHPTTMNLTITVTG